MRSNCRVCGAEGDHPSLVLREMQFGLRCTFEYVRCASCGSIQIVDVPADMSPYYPSNYYSFLADPETDRRLLVRLFFGLVRSCAPLVRFGLNSDHFAARLFRRAAANLDLRLAILEVFKQAGVDRTASILDVGSGAGFIPYCLKHAGFERVIGLDPFLDADRHYRNGLRVLKQNLDQFAAAEPAPFDLVMFHHSLEHMEAPLPPMQAAASLLKPDGRLLIRIPIVDSEAFDVYRENLVDLDAPRHLFVPTTAGMKAAAMAAGMSVYKIIYDSTEFQFWASEQYLRDIPLESEDSYRRNKRNSVFTRKQIRDYRRRAKALNQSGRGDTAAFFLKKTAADDAGSSESSNR